MSSDSSDPQLTLNAVGQNQHAFSFDFSDSSSHTPQPLQGQEVRIMDGWMDGSSPTTLSACQVVE